MAGAGKSAVGKILAGKLGWKCVDLDVLILETQGMSHHQYMKLHGEQALTDLENQLAMDLDFTNVVFAPPGSMIYSAKAMEKIKQESTIVYLEVTDPKFIEQRLGDNLYKNGIVGLEEKGLVGVMAERRPLYEKYADYTFRSGEQSKEEMAEIIIRGLNLNAIS